MGIKSNVFFISPGIYPSNFDSSRQHKKLNLLIEFYNSIFTKFILKHIGVELSFKIN